MIFVNYRQNGAGGRYPHVQVVESITEHLERHFGAASVFLDTTMRIGSPYPEELRRRLTASEVVVAVIHQDWLPELTRRENGVDWVREELETAFATGKIVVPLLLDGARLPEKHELPSSIAELATRQALALQFGQWQPGIARLIGTLEAHVSPLPEPKTEDPPRVRGTHWAGLLATAIAGFALPALVVRALVEDATGRPVWLTALGAIMAGCLALLFVQALVMYLIRKPLDSVHHAAARTPHDEKTGVIVGTTIAGLGVIVLLTGDMLSTQLRVLAVAFVSGVIVLFGARWFLYRENAKQWPRRWLPAHPAAVRAELAVVEKNLGEWAVPLSRLRHQQVRTALDQVWQAVEQLRALCTQSRWSWLLRATPWLTCPHVLWLAATLGAIASAYWEGRSGWAPPLWLLGFAVLAVAGYLATVDRLYRLQRWTRQVVVDSAPDELARLEARLGDMSIQPSKKGAA